MIRLWKRAVPHLVLASLLAAPVALIGCAEHAEYRVYDPDDGTYHNWNHNEGVYYNQWEHDTNRQHQDYRKRNQDDQRQYWQWRSGHHDHDQDQKQGNDQNNHH
jgi:hypothetical protein